MFRLVGIIFTCLLCSFCKYENREEAEPIYDKASLKAFILSTRSIEESQSLKQLDSILIVALNDSIVFRQTISFLEAPFSNPNSSYRKMNLYSKLLQAKMNSKWYSRYEREIASKRLQLLQQNNIGNAANDFTYITPAGYRKNMYDIKANYLLLYFNNPDCNACKEMKQALASSMIINQKLKTGELKILSIYTDKDEKLWLEHLNGYPKEWIQGRDENEYLYKNGIYDLRAIPTIYLLDKDKKVLLKDCTSLQQLEGKLLNTNQ